MSTHLQLANSTTMAILCGITILIVLLQPVIFMIVAFKRGKELNMTDQEMKEAARSSAIFSIIPSLPIIVSYLLLVPSLGRYFPWLRLSVVGSAAYETMVANMAAEALGLESITVPDIPADTFVFILFVVTIGILGGNIFNVFFLKAYDKKVESIKQREARSDHHDSNVPRSLWNHGSSAFHKYREHPGGCSDPGCRYHIDLRKQVCGEPQEVERVRIPAQHDRWNARCMCSESAYLGGKTI